VTSKRFEIEKGKREKSESGWWTGQGKRLIFEDANTINILGMTHDSPNSHFLTFER
jgi:hypothetical protein